VDTNGGQTAWRRGLLRGMRAREVASGQARLTSLSITRIDTAADAPGCAVSSLCNNRAHPGGLEEGGAQTKILYVDIDFEEGSKFPCPVFVFLPSVLFRWQIQE